MITALSGWAGSGQAAMLGRHAPGRSQGGALRGADAFVRPSHQENFGIVVAEALACSKPVLITDKVNIWREVFEQGAGLVAPDTPEGVRSLLRQLRVASAEERTAMQAIRVFDANFDVQNGSERLMQTIAREIGE